MLHRKHKHIFSRKGRLLPFIKLHRWLGLSSLLLVVILSVTGIMLNHTDEFKLNKQYIHNSFLLNLYGINMPDQYTYVQLGKDWFVQVGRQLYFNKNYFANESSILIGGYKSKDLNVIATQNAIFLLTVNGDLIEKLTADKNLPTPIARVGLISLDNHNKQFAIEVNKQIYISLDDYLSWTQMTTDNFEPLSLNLELAPQQKFYRNAYLGAELPVERVVLDIHSGRFLGSFGVYIMDLSAIFMILLGLSGSWIWVRRMKKKH